MNLLLQIWPKCVQGGRGVKKAGKSAYVLNGSPLRGTTMRRIAGEGETLMKANIPWFNCLIKPAIQTFQKERGEG